MAKPTKLTAQSVLEDEVKHMKAVLVRIETQLSWKLIDSDRIATEAIKVDCTLRLQKLELALKAVKKFGGIPL